MQSETKDMLPQGAPARLTANLLAIIGWSQKTMKLYLKCAGKKIASLEFSTQQMYPSKTTVGGKKTFKQIKTGHLLSTGLRQKQQQ